MATATVDSTALTEIRRIPGGGQAARPVWVKFSGGADGTLKILAAPQNVDNPATWAAETGMAFNTADGTVQLSTVSILGGHILYALWADRTAGTADIEVKL